MQYEFKHSMNTNIVCANIVCAIDAHIPAVYGFILLESILLILKGCQHFWELFHYFCVVRNFSYSFYHKCCIFFLEHTY